ncbi:MAG TPA: SsrA-binding protein SmpB [Candidatus Polarisedimenticolia bacterium]|nr:SsrA-binding protein SmpB [Candidatus Polarisedimenticolia bacterium]
MTYEKILAHNRQATFNYFILDRLEAGVVLQGTEVKSLRLGLCNLKDSYARVDGGEVWMYNCHIGPYPHGNRMNHEPLRPRKLLLHRNQIHKLVREAVRGTTLVPTKIYFKDKHIKVEIGIAKGKKSYDKRASLREKDLKREAAAAMRERGR